MHSTLEISSAIKLPEKYICRITKEILSDPVTASDNVNYEREAIERYFAIGVHVVSLVDNKPFEHRRLSANIELKKEIQKWKQDNGLGEAYWS